MTATANAENLKYDEITFYLILEEILAFVSSTTLVRKVKKLSPNKLHNDVLHDNSHLDRQIQFMVKF